MTTPSLVSSAADIEENLRQYEAALAEGGTLRKSAGHAWAWYVRELDGGLFQFAHATFVAYAQMSQASYFENYDELNVRDAEAALKGWSREVLEGSHEHERLLTALRAFLRRFGKKPSKRSRFRVFVFTARRSMVRSAEPRLDNLHERIHSDPAICGGRPVIRGTRMRVTDILSMLAEGVERDEILADFPYISADDISAALLFGAQASSHRILQAAE